MSGKINDRIREALCQDDLEKITGYMLEICELIVNDYTQRRKSLPNNENQIRSTILEEYLDNDDIRKDYDMLDYRFTPESPENYDGQGNYIGRTDIRINLKSDFDKHSAYYIVECKRIDGTADLNEKYVNEGIARFVTQKYSSYYGKNIMLGFIVKRIDIPTNILKIEKIQNASTDSHMHGSFKLIHNGTKCEMYRCEYIIASDELELRHIFSDLSDIVNG